MSCLSVTVTSDCQNRVANPRYKYIAQILVCYIYLIFIYLD